MMRRTETKTIDVYIYKLDLNAEKPVVEKFPAQIRDGTYGDEVIRWIGLNDYNVWHSEFDIKMLGVVNEPLDNVIELIVKRDKKESESIKMIEDYCCKKAACMRKKLYMFYRGIGASIQFMVFKTTKVKPIQVQASGPLLGDRANLIEEITHVLISIRMVCNEFDITPEEIQHEIYKKYPEGYKG